jgi:aminoglycoside/choline kinase family phosphotransferase
VGLTLFEDAGRDSLLDRAQDADSRTILKQYRTVLEQVHKLHSTAPRTLHLMEPFSPALFRWERELFAEHGLRDASPGHRAAVMKDLRQAGRVLHRLPQVLLHRDLQSSNIHFLGGEPVLIDFQGMRLGPAAYDLASLLCDPYVSLPLSVQLELLADCDTDELTAFWWAAIQRLAQALGAYGRLSALPGGDPFRTHIAPARRMMQRAIHLVDAPLPGLKAWLEASTRGCTIGSLATSATLMSGM